MDKVENNPLAAAVAAGLSFPIHGEFIGANGGMLEFLIDENMELRLISFQPVDYPMKCTFTGANSRVFRATLPEAAANAILERIRAKGVN
jgi:hypothetical protein